MAIITQSQMGMDDKVFQFVHAVSDRSVDWELKPAIFDSQLTRSRDPGANCILKIELLTFLKQVIPGVWEDSAVRQVATLQKKKVEKNKRYGFRRDEGTDLMITSWTTDEWDEFILAVFTQAKEWNRKFWLMPPDNFDQLDFKYGNSTFRPNIACEFKMVFVNGYDRPHINIEAVNVYDSRNNFYRAHMASYGSNAPHIRQTESADPRTGANRIHINHSTIVHEIGHAIGLGHIGIIRSLPHCDLAIVLNRHFTLGGNNITAALYKGGSNANVCYGSMAAFDDAENVMGMGSKFSAENAQPWLDRLPHHIRTPVDMSKWKVLTKEVLPMSLIFK